MKKIIPYPLFMVAAIILDRIVISSTQIGLTQSVRALMVLIFLTALALVVVYYLTKDWHYTNFAVLIIWVTLILYRAVYRYIKFSLPHQADTLALALIPIFCIMYILLVNRKRWNTFRKPVQLTQYFSIVFLVLFSFQIVRLARDFYTLFVIGTHSETIAISALNNDISLKATTQPDIYVIILDGYGRHDVIQDIYHYDNSDFIHELEKLGFTVPKKNHSNYVQTAYSMASLWNFEYLKPWNSSYEYTQYLLEPIQNGRVFRLLDQIGYTTVSFESEVQYASIRSADVYLSDFAPLNNFENLLLVDSPLEPFTDVFHLPFAIPNYNTHAERIQYELRTLKDVPTSIPGPKIIYTHIVAPHPPFIFDQYGDRLQIDNPYSLWDESESNGGQAEYMKGYREQVIFIDREILQVVKSILAQSKTPPIILIMGDHGPASMFNWRLDDPGCVWERTSNFYALLLPGHQNDGSVYDTMSPVNTFRVIFNTYFGTDLPMLEDRSYLRAWQQPTLNIDVTDKRDTHEGCTIQDE